MSYSNKYKDTIWTNHALERLKDRNIPQSLVWQAFKYADSSHKGKTAGTTEFQKKIDDRSFTVIASQNNKREWVILSCWVHPPYTGSIDIPKKKAYLRYKNSSFWGKVWIRFLQSLGLYGDF